MFDDLRQAFREALDNFNKELNKGQLSETDDELLIGMKNEIVREEAQIAGLRNQLLRTTAQIDDLTENIATAHRRQKMARDIGDGDTACLATDWATKARAQRSILSNKAAALQDEVDFHSRTIADMHSHFNEARSRRQTLSAQPDRASVYDSAIGAKEPLQAEDVEFKNALNELSSRQELDVNAALEELKRRMDEA